MTMKKECEDAVIEAAEAVVAAFVKDWKRSPYQWLQEIDVQVELVARLTTRIALLEPEHGQLLTFKAPLSNRIRGDHGPQLVSRITCEPYTRPPKVGRRVLPDIVIWGDCCGASGAINDGFWPILWLCEIKYKTPRADMTDLERLRGLCAGEHPRVRKGLLLSLHWNGVDDYVTPEDELCAHIRLVAAKPDPASTRQEWLNAR